MNTSKPLEVIAIDDLSPEDVAMLQALYSRSPASVREHLEKLRNVGSGKFMSQYYVKYGHKSIADCGDTTLFIENVSMLVAKAVQDWGLYSGQESSTRYIDFSKQGWDDPVNTPQSYAVMHRWVQFYLDALEPMTEHLFQVYPRRSTDKEEDYVRAIKARAFDIMRGFLPAGMHTNLSWHTNLRQAYDKLAELIFHPLSRVRAVAYAMAHTLKDKYRHSGFERVLKSSIPETEADRYRKSMVEEYSYFTPSFTPEFRLSVTLDDVGLAEYIDAFRDRPKGVELPRFMGDLGQITSEYLLDFGSFRDVQRHRNGIVRMPLLTTRYGFNEWYLQQLAPSLRAPAQELLDHQREEIAALPCSAVEKQNYIAMGYDVPVRITQGLPAFVYRMELRTAKTVHPTLRRRVQQEVAHFRSVHPEVVIHADMDQDDWDVRRGTQTILAR